MSTTQTHGHCLCRAIKYAVSGEPIWCCYCHCSSCRRQAGSAVATFVAFEKNNYRVTDGEVTKFESSPGVQRSFCNTCGTPISYESKYVPTEIHLFSGSLEHPESFVPQHHVFYEEKVPWFDTDDKTHRYSTLPRNENN